ncbi:unnamed protein product, partial [Scytosiphon promiscuus]
VGHERLSIIDPESGAQPLFSPDRQVQQFSDRLWQNRGSRRSSDSLVDDSRPTTLVVGAAPYGTKGGRLRSGIKQVEFYIWYDTA